MVELTALSSRIGRAKFAYNALFNLLYFTW